MRDLKLDLRSYLCKGLNQTINVSQYNASVTTFRDK